MSTPKHALGQKLRSLRKERGVSGEELAALLEYSQAGVSKIENGLIKPDLEYIGAFCDALGLSKAVRSDLIETAQLFLWDFDRWRSDSDTPKIQKIIEQREKRAKLLRVFTWFIVPGLLQTRGYVTAIYKQYVGGTYLQRTISARMSRQKVLADRGKSFEFVMGEQTLYTRIGEDEQHLEQLEHLERCMRERIFDIRILPARARLPIIPNTSFVIFDSKLVSVDQQHGAINFWNEEEVRSYLEVFRAVRDISVGGGGGLKLIGRAIKELRSGAERRAVG